MSYSENYKLIKWAPIKERAPVIEEEKGKAAYFMPDIAEFVAPGRVQIGSRTKLREYEKRTQTRQCGELKTASDFSNESRRENTVNSKAVDRAYRTALEKLGLQ